MMRKKRTIGDACSMCWKITGFFFDFYCSCSCLSRIFFVFVHQLDVYLYSTFLSLSLSISKTKPHSHSTVKSFEEQSLPLPYTCVFMQQFCHLIANIPEVFVAHQSYLLGINYSHVLCYNPE